MPERNSSHMKSVRLWENPMSSRLLEPKDSAKRRKPLRSIFEETMLMSVPPTHYPAKVIL